MSDAPTSGVEAPSRFMMGLEDDPSNNDAAMDAALQKAFGVEANDLTVGNPNAVVDDTVNADGAVGGSEDIEPGGDPTAVPGDEPHADDPTANDGAQVQGGEVDPNVATGEGLDFAALFTQRYGRAPLPSEYEGLLSLADWANSLTPEQQEAINRALSPSLAGDAAGGQGQGSSPPSDPDPLLDDVIAQYGDDDPLVQAFRKQQEQVAELRQSYQQRYAQEQQTQAINEINTTTADFRSSIPDLTDDDIDRLQGAVARAGVFPSLVQHHGSVGLAMKEALNWAYWNDEVCREREISRRAAEHPTVQGAHQQRQAKAASVTGTGGNGASRTEAPAKNTDPWAAVADGIREAQNNGVPG